MDLSREACAMRQGLNGEIQESNWSHKAASGSRGTCTCQVRYEAVRCDEYKEARDGVGTCSVPPGGEGRRRQTRHAEEARGEPDRAFE